MSSRRPTDRKLVLAVTALAALLRLPGIGTQNLWCDEIYSLNLSTLSGAEIFTFQDGHPPLFHLLEKVACMALGTDLCGRLLAATIGIATVPLLFVLGRRLFDRRIGLWAAFLLSTSSFHIWYSREGRMYALVVFFTTVSSYFLPDLSGHRWRSTIAFAAATLAGLMSHYAYVAVAATQILFVAILGTDARRRRRFAMLAAVAAIAGASTLILSPALRELSLGPIGPSRTKDLFAVPYAVFTLLAGFGVGPSVRMLQESRGLASILAYWPEISATAGIIALAFVVAARNAIRTKPWGVYLLVAVTLPLIIVGIVSSTTGLAFNPRYAIGTLPAWCLLIAVGIARSPRNAATAIVVGILAVNALSQFRDHADPRYQREQIREAAAHIIAYASPSDRIYFGPLYVRETLAHYLPPEREISSLPVKRIVRDDQVETIFEIIAPRDSSVWLLRTREWSDDPHGRLARALDARIPRTAVREFAGVRLYRLDP
jgi:mannosyltransferase